MIVGSGGRENAFARALAKDAVVCAMMTHANPTIIAHVVATGGDYHVGDICAADAVVAFAKKSNSDYVFVNADNPLASGVVDALLAAGIKAVGPTREGARIEWDKVYSMDLMHSLFPEYTPHYQCITDVEASAAALSFFEEKDLAVVVKPRGLTGGKGVKVMGEHLKDYQESEDYIRHLLNSGEDAVLLCEKVEGYEFTVMGFSDGKTLHCAPASYDYPYRYSGDTGAGTGGMGCVVSGDTKLPFISQQNYDVCETIMTKVVEHLSANNIHFNGVLNGGFFVTKKGIRFMEFNARFGDPEAINILALLDSSFSELLCSIYAQDLHRHQPYFKKAVSVVKYLVAPNYPKATATDTTPLKFILPINKLEAEGLAVHCASMVADDLPKSQQDGYCSIGSSRIVALEFSAPSITEASHKLNEMIARYAPKELEYRADIGLDKVIAIV